MLIQQCPSVARYLLDIDAPTQYFYFLPFIKKKKLSRKTSQSLKPLRRVEMVRVTLAFGEVFVQNHPPHADAELSSQCLPHCSSWVQKHVFPNLLPRELNPKGWQHKWLKIRLMSEKEAYWSGTFLPFSCCM